MLENKMPIQTQLNNMELSKFSELDRLCPIELMLISLIIPFVFIVAKAKAAQDRFKGQCILVLVDLKKVQTILPRSCDEECLISLALRCRLNEEDEFKNQQTHLAIVDRALEKSTKIMHFTIFTIDNKSEYLSEQPYLLSWKRLTSKNARV